MTGSLGIGEWKEFCIRAVCAMGWQSVTRRSVKPLSQTRAAMEAGEQAAPQAALPAKPSFDHCY